jgi:L-galactose dehydrogenase
MEYRSLGRTGLKVSPLAYGGSSLGSAFRSIDETAGIRSVHVAIDRGINLFDTAPYYGATTAETVLGKALRTIPREQYLLATKVGRYGAQTSDFDFSADRVTRSVDESLTRLCVDHIDFIQAHDVEFGDIDEIVNETIPALQQLKTSGKVRFVGISGLPISLLSRVLDQGAVDQIQSYCHFCLNDTALLGLLPRLEKKQVALFNSAPLAMRLLSDDGPPAWHPAPARLREKCAEAAAHCRTRGADISKLALQFAVSDSRIPTTILGTANPANVEQNVRAVEEPIDQELLAEVQAILAPVHNLTWPSGRPENNV